MLLKIRYFSVYDENEDTQFTLRESFKTQEDFEEEIILASDIVAANVTVFYFFDGNDPASQFHGNCFVGGWLLMEDGDEYNVSTSTVVAMIRDSVIKGCSSITDFEAWKSYEKIINRFQKADIPPPG